MRDPMAVLSSLASKSAIRSYKFQRLYRNLFNPNIYLLAYSNIATNQGNMTSGIDGKTVDGMSLDRITRIIEKIKDESYQPTPVKRVYIPKKNGKVRPLGIPSFDDKLVQEVVRLLLESIYEGQFSNYSHGFRPNRSCHSALSQFKDVANGTTWFVEGDIKGFFDSINHSTLLTILARRIEDARFLNLIAKFLRAGYIEEWQLKNTYSGTPQGGIISPILSNIYLNELDSFVESLKANFDKGHRKSRSKEYRSISGKLGRLHKKCRNSWDTMNDAEKLAVKSQLKDLKQAQLSVHHYDPMDSSYKRLIYVRYADDFLIGIVGSKSDAVQIKTQLADFLKSSLNLELSMEKTLITHSSKKARFLGYDISIHRTQKARKNKNGHAVRFFNLKPALSMPKEKWFNKLKSIGALDITGKNTWVPKHRTALINNDDLEILSIYNAEIRGFYNYYQLAYNVSTLHKFLYVMKFSLLKTLANKHKSTVSKIASKYGVGKRLAVKYSTAKGEQHRFFYDEGFKWKLNFKGSSQVDMKPNTLIYSGRNSLMNRLLASKCEWCGASDVSLEMHHVRKLKDLVGRKRWERFMISRKRKTVAMCLGCHDALHAGKLD
ncbi:reverse transcriptase domain-containing protein [Brevibacillus reuszeri]|uniref:reverse transcriptase domain-containing protein n=1 Tax=Brevibacillus reuszeri TaxID=54915 RepID=UPI003D1E6BA6